MQPVQKSQVAFIHVQDENMMTSARATRSPQKLRPSPSDRPAVTAAAATGATPVIPSTTTTAAAAATATAAAAGQEAGYALHGNRALEQLLHGLVFGSDSRRAVLPFHDVVFRGMLARIQQDAVRIAASERAG